MGGSALVAVSPWIAGRLPLVVVSVGCCWASGDCSDKFGGTCWTEHEGVQGAKEAPSINL